MCFFRFYLILFLLVVLSSSCQGREESFDFSSEYFVILSNGDKMSAGAADYLFDHLKKRISNDQNLELVRSDEGDKSVTGEIIYLEVVPDLLHDYQVINEHGKLSIFAKNDEVMLWLSYMLIDRMSYFHSGINVSDLAPTFISFENATGNIPLTYREPHLLPNTDWDYLRILGTNNLERDWGLWGHNLKNVFTDEIPDSSYAWFDNKRNHEQFCFSALSTFNAISTFILDQYGDGRQDPKWFMIAPNDNDISCTCAACVKLGNTKESSTPAVVTLVNKLAEKYPKHFFFTTAYLSTVDAPKVRMRGNTGVFISTIDLPKHPFLNESNGNVDYFIKLLKAWKEKTPNIYLWDYISNFDDYLTPYPILLRLQSQIDFFLKNGVNGLFLNGSGYDYSPFDDVKTYTIAALLHDNTLPVEKLVVNYFNRFYPVNGEALSSYYLELENKAFSGKADLPIYLSFLRSQELFFDNDAFIKLYDLLTESLNSLGQEEKYKVNKLLVAWSYTYLQIMYHKGTLEGGFLEKTKEGWKVSERTVELLEKLESYNEFPELKNYKESEGSLEAYVKEWKLYMKRPFEFDKYLSNMEVRSSKSNNLIESGKLLNDYVLGFSSDFNQGWLLSGDDIKIRGNVKVDNEGAQGVSLRFLVNSRHRMLIPDEVKILVNNTKEHKVVKSAYKVQGDVAYLNCPIELNNGDELKIEIKKNSQIRRSVIACDEIQLF